MPMLASNSKNSYFSEPVKLKGEGKYNLNNIKEIKLTESYFELGMDVKKCQNKEDVNECTTRQYINQFLHQCECLPFSINSSKNVICQSIK